MDGRGQLRHHLGGLLSTIRHGAGLQEDRVTQADVALAFRSGWGETGPGDWRGWEAGREEDTYNLALALLSGKASWNGVFE